MDALMQTVRHTLRQWTRSPAFMVLAVLTIALGSAGVTTMLSVTDAVLLRTQPGVRNPEGLVQIRVGDRAGRSRRPMPPPPLRPFGERTVG